jgi:hypothetical protein
MQVKTTKNETFHVLGLPIHVLSYFNTKIKKLFGKTVTLPKVEPAYFGDEVRETIN